MFEQRAIPLKIWLSVSPLGQETEHKRLRLVLFGELGDNRGPQRERAEGERVSLGEENRFRLRERSISV